MRRAPALFLALLVVGCFPAPGYEEYDDPPYSRNTHLPPDPEPEYFVHGAMAKVPLLAEWRAAGRPSYTPPATGPLAKVVLIDDDFTSRPDAMVLPDPSRDLCYEPFLLLIPKDGTASLLDPASGGWVGMQDLLDGQLGVVQTAYRPGYACGCGETHGASASVSLFPLTVPPGVGDHAAMLVVVRTGGVGEFELGVAYAEDDHTELLNAQVLAARFHAGDSGAPRVTGYDSATTYLLRAVLTKLPPEGGEPPARTEADRDYMAQRVSWLTALMVPRGEALFRSIEDFWRRALFSEGAAHEQLAEAVREAEESIWTADIRRELAAERDDPTRRTFEVTSTLRLPDGGMSCEVMMRAANRDGRYTAAHKLEFSQDGRLRKILAECWSCHGSGDCAKCPASGICSSCSGSGTCPSCGGMGFTPKDLSHARSRGRRLVRTDPPPVMASDRSSPEAAARYYADLAVRTEYLTAIRLREIWRAENEEARRFLAPDLAAAFVSGGRAEASDPDTLRDEVVSVTRNGEEAEAVLRTANNRTIRLALVRDPAGAEWRVARLDVRCSECKEGGGSCAACGGDEWIVARPRS